MGSNPSRDATASILAPDQLISNKKGNCFNKNARYVALCCSPLPDRGLSLKGEDREMATLSDVLSAYQICAQAEGRSPKTIRWIVSSVYYFSDFLGPKQEISYITADDFRRFIIALQRSTKFRHHPFNKPMLEKLSRQEPPASHGSSDEPSWSSCIESAQR